MKDSTKTREARKKRKEDASMTDEQKKEKKERTRFLHNVELAKQRRQERGALVRRANEQAQPICDAQYRLGMLLRQGSVVKTMLANLSTVKAASERVDPSLAPHVTIS